MAERGRVLIVDDEVMAARVVARVLGKEHDIVEVRSGRDALARFQAGEHFDLVICDLIMPEMTGMELFEHMQGAGMALTDRMIFMTGGAFTPRAQQFVEGLPTGRCLEKPFESEALRSLARELLEARDSARDSARSGETRDEGRIDEAPPASAPRSA